MAGKDGRGGCQRGRHVEPLYDMGLFGLRLRILAHVASPLCAAEAVPAPQPGVYSDPKDIYRCGRLTSSASWVASVPSLIWSASTRGAAMSSATRLGARPMLPVVWALITPLLKQVNAKLAGDAKEDEVLVVPDALEGLLP